MAEDADIARWIGDLSNPDELRRAAAAESIRTAAFNRCFAESNAWIRDAAFLKLARRGEPARPGADPPRSVSFVAGIAVRPSTFEQIRAANGSPRLANVPPDQDVLEFELHFGPAGALDILTTSNPAGSGAIARYLEKFGEGIQQVELSVTNVDEATELLRSRFGLTPIYPETRPGADGTRVNFFLAPAARGTKCLIELVEAGGEN